MKIEDTRLEGVKILIPNRFSDDRGFFSEVWNQKTLAALGLHLNFVQDNHSYSAKPGTVRGLHYQSPPHPQDKLVRVARGSVLDVAVDVRRGSPSYGEWVGVELSAENGRQLLIPVGFLHGFVTLEANTEVLYKCTDYYAKDCDGAVRFDDADIGIDWGFAPGQFVLSEKDLTAPSFKQFDSPFQYGPKP